MEEFICVKYCTVFGYHCNLEVHEKKSGILSIDDPIPKKLLNVLIVIADNISVDMNYLENILLRNIRYHSKLFNFYSLNKALYFFPAKVNKSSFFS